MGRGQFECGEIVAGLIYSSVLLRSLKSSGGVHLFVVSEVSCEVSSCSLTVLIFGVCLPSQRVMAAMTAKETRKVHCALTSE